jgi:hypothetical protein
MKAAWQALLRGDLAERDRLCNLAEARLRQDTIERINEIAAQVHRKPGNA